MKASKDYIEDRSAALELVRRIEEYWHSRGYHGVKAWTEPDIQASGRKFHYVRSNISFRVPN